MATKILQVSGLGDDVLSGASSVAIGVFDGMHRGHQAVLRSASAAARSNDLECVALTFDRHPSQIIAPDKAPGLITSLSQKIELISALGCIDTLVIVEFEHEFAEYSPQDFIEKVLVGRLCARSIRVGADFQFGRARTGNVALLKSSGVKYGFDAQVVHAITGGGQRISSSLVRSLISAGDIEGVKKMLGRPFTQRGVVTTGKRLGRTLGFPTANLALEDPQQLMPEPGVYAGYVSLLDSGSDPITYRSAINVGVNATVEAGNQIVKVEAHIIDGFNDDIYGKRIDVAFVRRLRPSVKFDGVDQLVEQMHKDVRRTKQVIKVK